MTEGIKTIVARVTGNPKTSTLGVVVVALYGAGEALRENMLEPWGSIVIGVAGIVALVALLLAKDSTPQDPPPPAA